MSCENITGTTSFNKIWSLLLTNLDLEGSAGENDKVAPSVLRVTLFYTGKKDSVLLKRSSPTLWKHNL